MGSEKEALLANKDAVQKETVVLQQQLKRVQREKEDVIAEKAG